MKQFGVHKDLESYRALVDILPKGKMVSTNIWQKAFAYYPKQQGGNSPNSSKVLSNVSRPVSKSHV
jgi:hypothetical protein